MSIDFRPRRHWFRFKLKTLFILVAVLAVGLGWFKWKVERKRIERVAARKLMNCGAVLYFEPYENGPGLPYWLFGERWDFWMENVIAVSFEPLDGRPDLVADAEPRYDSLMTQFLPAPPAQPQPSIREGPITNSGLAHLKQFKSRERLNLADTHIDDAGLLHLKELGGLKYLWLRGTQVTDAGVADLQEALPKCTIIR
ncbi:MAG TPA: hypothetical protein VGX78_04365 [Pirellulales bacterium]|jgi:hypothetical protein|nr:hypothetical protein [Pirellulales bacterium]